MEGGVGLKERSVLHNLSFMFVIVKLIADAFLYRLYSRMRGEEIIVSA
jgi:hypothetical protein